MSESSVPSDMTEDEIHDHPEFAAIRDAVAALADSVRDIPAEDQAALAAAMARSVNVEVVAHAGQHRVMDTVTQVVPPPILYMFMSGFVSTWVDGFMVGQRFQATKDAELATATCPDTIDGLT